jgi:hypothetical protein
LVMSGRHTECTCYFAHAAGFLQQLGKPTVGRLREAYRPIPLLTRRASMTRLTVLKVLELGGGNETQKPGTWRIGGNHSRRQDLSAFGESRLHC